MKVKLVNAISLIEKMISVKYYQNPFYHLEDLILIEKRGDTTSNIYGI
jgi:hypothetical protein